MSTADMIERRWLKDWPDANAAQRDLVEALKARGATFGRISLQEAARVIVGEGWLIRPDDQGELPL